MEKHILTLKPSFKPIWAKENAIVPALSVKEPQTSQSVKALGQIKRRWSKMKILAIEMFIKSIKR